MRPLIFSFLLAGTLPVSPQQDTMSLEDALRMGQEFLQENLDPDFLAALGDVDFAQAQALFQRLQERLDGDYVLDLAELRKFAAPWLPVLEAHEETAPYAAWLRVRLDYLEAAEQMRDLTPPPKPVPGQLPRPRPNPSAELEKKVWSKRIDARSIPKSAEPVVASLKAIFAGQGMPRELVWLAEVESSFNPKARSPVGAAGLFQLMPATAKSLGLSTFLPDERLNAEKSAAAAARYLKYLHGRFRDWKLTLAAYNLGEGRLQKLLERYQAGSFEAISPRLPAETQMYVPKFAALLQKREGRALDKLAAPKVVGK